MLYVYIVISVAFVLIFPFWIRNKNLFSKSFSNLLGNGYSDTLLQMHNTLHNGMFNATKNFFNYTANLILKFIIFTIMLVILYCTKTIIIPSVYLLYVVTSWSVYKKRKSYYDCVCEDGSDNNSLSTALKASFSIPLYHTILLALIEFVYIFEI